MTAKCKASTKAGSPCKRNAQEGSDYCFAHRATEAVAGAAGAATASASATADKATQTTIDAVATATDKNKKATSKAKKAASKAAKKAKATATGAVDKAEEVVSNIADEIPVDEAKAEIDARFERLVAEVNKIVDEVRERVPGFNPPALSAEKLTTLLKENAEKLPGINFDITVESELITNLQKEVEGKSAQDFLDMETWKGLWYILNAAVQEQAGSVTELLGERLKSVPGAEAVTDFQSKLEIDSPQDFLQPTTWKGIFNASNEVLQEQVGKLRNRAA